MRNSKLVITTFFFIAFITGYTQQIALDKVSKEELEMTSYDKDIAAPAIYLNKQRETYFDYKESGDFIIVNEFTERIKILNKEGLKYATKQIRSFKRDYEKEEVERIVGKTYHLEGDKIIETSLSNDAIFKTKLSEFWDETAFTMPDVKVGSVVEWSYKTRSPFYKIDDLIIQENIPVQEYYAKIRIPGMYFFRRLRKGYFDILPKESIEKRSVYIQETNGVLTKSASKLNFNELIAEYEKKDIPALKEEVYVDNYSNYQMSVIYELVYTEFQKGKKKEYASTWKDVAKSIFDNPDFGIHIINAQFLRETAKLIKDNNKTENDIIEAALDYIKTKITWNGERRILVEDNLRKVFNEGVGNSAEINLSLIALLRECGLKAYPILLSSKKHGIPLFPTREGFDFVVGGVKLDDDIILLDATNKLSAPNILPVDLYNWSGRMINERGESQEIDLLRTVAPTSKTFVNAILTDFGVLTGQLKERLVSLPAFELRNSLSSIDKSKWHEIDPSVMVISDLSSYKIEGLDDLQGPLVKSFNFIFENAVDKIDDKLFFTPLSFLKLSESPFKSDFRQFPISFDYPLTKDIILNIKLPDGYTVFSLPEEINIGLPDDLGTFLYSIKHSNGSLNLMMRFKINKNRIPLEYYESLKEFFKLRVDKENEKVVLEKV